MSGGSNRTSPTLPMASSPEEADFDHTKCTAARAKSVIKTIFAQLFSHLGLCLLVIGYSVMGAVIFVSLEAPNETKTRQDVSRMKNLTLNQLYDLTGKKITVLSDLSRSFPYQNSQKCLVFIHLTEKSSILDFQKNL